MKISEFAISLNGPPLKKLQILIFLLIVFNADTHHMIPLYSVGVFLSFTLSQVGMVIKWRKIKGQGWKHKCFINSFGAVMTFIGMIIVLWTKFTGGAWMLIIAIPMLTLIMSKIKKHYDLIAEQLKVNVATIIVPYLYKVK